MALSNTIDKREVKSLSALSKRSRFLISAVHSSHKLIQVLIEYSGRRGRMDVVAFSDLLNKRGQLSIVRK